jgi:8-oxoguanine deaminase
VFFCAPQPAVNTVINGKLVVQDGRIIPMEMGFVVETHNRCARELAAPI